MSLQIGYCTNVHANASLDETRENLGRYALAVKHTIRPDRPMGIGLWLSAHAAHELCESGRAPAFAAWLNDVGLVPFTFNGFPYGDFHQAVVKHRVYTPTWWQAERLDYTLNLVELQHALLPPGLEGSISTLPLAWAEPALTDAELRHSVDHLIRVVERLSKLESESGRLIYLCLEPEPGCVLQRSQDIVRLFEDELLRHPDANENLVRRHIRVCHDICHTVVMFEEQEDAWGAYRDAGIEVGKVQVSSAICVRFDDIPANQRGAAIAQLASFAEDRYLHQTVVREQPDRALTFYEDLPPALASVGDPANLMGQWRVHFHVPVYLDRFGWLATSRDDVLRCVELARTSSVTHFEVETYAWGVLPQELQEASLAEGIVREMRWFNDQLDR